MPRVANKPKTVKEMKVQLEALQREIDGIEREEKLTALGNTPQFKAVARQLAGMSLTNQQIAELFNKPAAPPVANARRRAVAKPVPQIKVKPKYRNPAAPEQTWTGRGKRPRWVEDLVTNQGASMEDLLIKE